MSGMAGRAGWGFVVWCAVVSSVACQPNDHRINVFNDTGWDIVVTVVKHDGETADVEVPPDLIRLIILDRECERDLVARTAGGRELARLGREICQDHTWVFDPDGGVRLIKGYVFERHQPTPTPTVTGRS